MKKRQTLNYALLMVYIGYTCIYLDKTAISLSMVSIAEALNLAPGQKGLIMSSFFLGYTLFQIPYSFVINKVGSRKVMIMSVTLVGLFMIAFGWGTSLAYLILIRFMTGSFAHAGYPSSVSSFISSDVPKEKRGTIQSMMISSSGLAGILGPLAIVLLINSLGWRHTYTVLGIIFVLMGFLMSKIIPKEFGKKSLDTKQSFSFKMVLKDKNVRVLIFASFFVNAAFYGLNGWLPSFLSDVFKLPMGKLSMITMLMGLMTLVSSMLSGVMVAKYFVGKEKQLIFATLLAGAISVYLVNITSELIWSVLYLCLAIVLVSVAFSTLMSFPVKIFPASEVAEKYAMINSVGVFGGFVAPTVMGMLVEKSGGNYISAFLFISIGLIISGIIVMFVNNKEK